jgi:hypothetical protein
MVNFNGSFVSPLSDVSVVAQLAKSSDHLVSLYNGLTIWTALLYLLLAAVVYDQGRFSPFVTSSLYLETIFRLSQPLTLDSSQIYLPEGVDRRPGYENSVHGTFPAVDESRLRDIQGAMEKWSLELRLRIP